MAIKRIKDIQSHNTTKPLSGNDMFLQSFINKGSEAKATKPETEDICFSLTPATRTALTDFSLDLDLPQNKTLEALVRVASDSELIEKIVLFSTDYEDREGKGALLTVKLCTDIKPLLKTISKKLRTRSLSFTLRVILMFFSAHWTEYFEAQ